MAVGSDTSDMGSAVDAILQEVDVSIRECAGEMANALATISDDGASDVAATFAGMMGAGQKASTSDMLDEADAVFVEMLADVQAGAQLMRGTVAQLDDVRMGLSQMMPLVEGLRRISKISTFLATQAGVEGAHLSGEQGAEFGISAQRIRALAETSKALCIDIEEIVSKLSHRVIDLALEVQAVLNRVEHNVRAGRGRQDNVRSDLNEYRRLVDGHLSALHTVEQQTADDVRALFRGLQFEDMTVQLVDAVRRRVDSGDATERDAGPVMQHSMAVGAVELF